MAAVQSKSELLQLPLLVCATNPASYQTGYAMDKHGHVSEFAWK